MKKKILIVDDDLELCEEVSEILTDEGHAVKTISDGAQGRGHIRKNKYDIIILDYRMPGLNGVEVLKFIKKSRIKSKIFITSGRPFIEKLIEEENLSADVYCVINKPFDIKLLIEKINCA